MDTREGSLPAPHAARGERGPDLSNHSGRVSELNDRLHGTQWSKPDSSVDHKSKIEVEVSCKASAAALRQATVAANALKQLQVEQCHRAVHEARTVELCSELMTAASSGTLADFERTRSPPDALPFIA